MLDSLEKRLRSYIGSATRAQTLDVRSGSNTALGRCRLNVRITPESGRVADTPDRQVRANRTQAPQQPTSPTDHLVGASERVGRISRPSRPGGRQIDNEIELGRLLDWNVGRLRPAQNRRASDRLPNSYRLFVRLRDTESGNSSENLQRVSIRAEVRLQASHPICG